MKAMGIFISLMAVMVIGYFAVGFADSVEEPTAGTAAANQYANLTQATDVASAGLQGTMLLLVGAMALAAAGFFYHSIKSR